MRRAKMNRPYASIAAFSAADRLRREPTKAMSRQGVADVDPVFGRKDSRCRGRGKLTALE
jgi:hypothetical protein